MTEFELNEIKGRKILESFLIQVGATDQHETEDTYNPVDYYFTYKDKKVVAEIKIRDKKYENYPTHLMEVSKFKALVKDRKDNNLDMAYYVNFFTDGETVNAYWYSTSTISKYATTDTKYCNRTTAIDNGKRWKKVFLIPKDKAKIFMKVNDKWIKSN